MDRIRNGHIKGSLGVTKIAWKIRENRLRYCVERRNNDIGGIREVENWRGKGVPKKKRDECY